LCQEYRVRGMFIRFDKDLNELRRTLRSNIPTAIMSGTAPGEAVGSEASLLATFVERTFRPQPITIPKRSYAEFVPTARILVTPVDDSIVRLLDEAIGTDLMFALNNLCAVLQSGVDEHWLFPRLPALLAASPIIRTIRLSSGRFVPAKSLAIQACTAIQAAVNRSVFLQEDMLEGYDAEIQDFLFYAWDADEPRRMVRSRFTERPADNEYRPSPRGKYESVLELAKLRANERGVVFVRYVELAEQITASLRSQGITTEIIHGDKSPREQAAAKERFSEGQGLLVITRDTGKRGLDLPRADYAVFYSPKASELSSWQELSRIRSNIGRTKDSYFLVYAGTREVQRLNELLDLMEASGRAYDVIRPAPSRSR
jgi:hypothetical protein